MAKRRLNTNLVGYLTAAGIVLAVGVVGVAALNASRRDPAAIAERAVAKEKAGDLGGAVRLYKSAYNEGKEAKYLIEGARVEREQGRMREMFSLLNLAHIQAPLDPEVLTALLSRYWEMRNYALGQWRIVLELADSLLDIPGHENNLLALASRGDALDRMRDNDPTYAKDADNCIAKAEELDATNPYVALVSANHRRRQAAGKARQAAGRGEPALAMELMSQAWGKQVEVLKPALEAHPDNVELRVALAQALGSDEQWDAARGILDAGLAQNPDDVDLHFAMAGVIAESMKKSWEETSPEQMKQAVEQGLSHVERALALDPALYAAYTRKVELLRMGWGKDGSLKSDRLKCELTTMETYAGALDATVGLRSIRAELGHGAKLQLIGHAFDSAFSSYKRSQDEAGRDQAITYVRRFLQEGQTQYAEHALTPLMEGHVALVDGDDRLAIKAFTRAIEQAEKQLGSAVYGQLAKEELVKIYNRTGSLGLAAQLASELLVYYDKLGSLAPLWLWANQADILIRLQKPQEALDLIDSIAMDYPDNAGLRAIRARALALADRGEEAERLLASADDDNPRMLMQRAQIELINRNYSAAVELLEQLLEADPNNQSVVRKYLDVLTADDRRDEALAYARKRLTDAQDQDFRRTLQSYEVMLSESDPDKRRERLLAVIGEIPDEYERANEYFGFWAANDEFEKALPYLETMERLRPDDVKIKQLQFDMATRLSQCERAAKYEAILSRLNADQAGGATYRGRYELVCGDPEKALSEFRAAEREFPNDTAIKIRIAQALLSMAPPRYSDAIRPLELAVEYDPRSFPARSLLYTCYNRTGHTEQGIIHLKAAAKINPNNPFIKERKQLLDEELDPQSGVARREQLRSKQPDNAENLLRLAYLYERINDDKHAGECLNEALALDPSNIGAARTAASFYARLGDRAAAEKILAAYRESQEGIGKVFARIMYAQLYEQLSDFEAAYGAYQQARDEAAELPAEESSNRKRAIVLSAREQAEFFRRGKRVDDMIEAYGAVLDNLSENDTPSIQAARRTIIRGHLMLRRFGEARKDLDSYRRDYPDEPAGMLAEAELLTNQPRRQLNDARALLTRVLEEYPDNAWARYMRGRISIAQGRYELARDDLLQTKAIEPEGFGLRHRMALVQIYEITERVELAENELREMIELERNDRYAELQLVDLLNRAKQHEKAQEFVNELIAADPDEPFWFFQLGLAFEAREEYSAAVGPFREAIKIVRKKGANPPEDICIHLIRSLVMGGRAAEALQAYDSLGPLAVTPRIQTAAAEACLAENERNLAIGLIEQAVDIASRRSASDLRSVAARAAADDMLGREETLAILRRVLNSAANPSAKHAIKNILAMYLALDDDADKRAEGEQLRKSVLEETKPGEKAHIDALLVEAQALDATDAGDERVVAAYEGILKQDPDNLQALNNLAYRLTDALDRPAEALPYAERLQDLAPNHANILDTVGWVEFRNGMPDEAIATFQSALRLDPDHLAARYHIGLVYAAQGQRTTASHALRRALELAVERGDAEYQKDAQEALDSLR